MQKIITNNSGEIIKIKWDDARFALIARHHGVISERTIILNPREMDDIVEFVKEVKNGSK